MLRNNYSYELATPIPLSEPNRAAMGPSWSKLRLKPATNSDKTFTILQKLWSEIPTDLLKIYVNSMKNRCMAVIVAKGGHKKYWSYKTYSKQWKKNLS